MDWIHEPWCGVLSITATGTEVGGQAYKKIKKKTFNDVCMCTFECGFVHVSSGV